jgi:dienelactone hydrolase
MKFTHSLTALLLLALTVTACNNAKDDNQSKNDTAATASIKEEAVTYRSDTNSFKGYVAYNKNQQGVRPGILVVPEWWGLNDYARGRAKQLAELGYIAIAVDMYGNGKTATDPKEAQALAGPFYTNPQLTRQRIDAAIAKLKTYTQTDTANIGAIGYCFGGYAVLNAAKLGASLKAVVSFHGNLVGVPPSGGLKTKILVCHGAADQFVSADEVNAFKKSMDSVKADYKFIAYPEATHAFTNPAATEIGKKFNLPVAYNAKADTASWNDMKTFFENNLPVKR